MRRLAALFLTLLATTFVLPYVGDHRDEVDDAAEVVLAAALVVE